MRIRPGPQLLRFGAALVALGLLCFLWRPAGWLIPPFVALAVGLFLYDVRHLRKRLGGITVRRELPVSARRDVPFPVVLKIKNAGSDEIAVEVRDLVPEEATPRVWCESVALSPEGEATLHYEIRIAVRGLHRFGAIWLRIPGKYGMVEGQRRYECPGEVKVFPETAGSEEGLLKDALSEKRLLDRLTRMRLRGEGTEFESLSEYRLGDDPRRIDWRVSARHRRLIVRRFQLEQHRDVVILLDCGRLMGTDAGKGSKLDRAVDSAMMLSRVALGEGDRCGLGIFDDQVLGYLPPISGPRAFQTLTESMYNVQSRWRESNFAAMFATLQMRQAKRSLVVILSDIVDEDTSERFRSALASLGRRHVVIFAALKTPLLWEILNAPIGALRDVSQKAVVMRLLRERERALHSVRRTGIHVLDVEPVQLTVPLVNQYIELRERNLL